MLSEPGTAPSGFIPLAVPEIRGRAWEYVKQCLDTNWVSSVGPFVDRFEQMAAQYTGTKFAVATVNGTAALHIALRVAGVQAGEEVLVSALTFIASANAIRYLGAYPVFIDAEPEYWQMDPAQVEIFLKKQCVWRSGSLHNKTTGRRIKAILPVHVLGHPVDMDPILKLAKKYELVVIEDAAEALGSRYKGKQIGQLGDMTCFSFNGNKIITTGGGGMLVTNNQTFAERAKYLTTQAKNDPVEYIHNEMGYNYRLTNLQAALGVAQMEVLNDFIQAKRRIAGCYNAAFAAIPGTSLFPEARWAFSNCWLYTILIDEIRFGCSSRDLLRHFASHRIQARPLWQPMHRSPSFTDSSSCQCPVADQLCQQALSLPCSVGLTEEQQDRVIQAVIQNVQQRCRAA